jgi:hypothetical protein
MPTVSDEVLTIFRLVGEDAYERAFQRAAGAAETLETRLEGLRRQQQLAVGVAAAGAAGLLFFGRAALEAANAEADLTRAAGNFRGAFPKEELAAFSGELSKLTGIDDERIAGLAGVLGTFQISPQAARDLTLPILNATESLKALGLTAESTAAQVGKAIQTGNASGLRRSGIIIDAEQFKAAQSEAERTRIVVAALQAQGGDAAVVFRDSLPGALQAFQTALGNTREGLGSGLGAPLRAIVETGTAVLNFFNSAPPAVQQFAGVVGVTLAGAATVYGARTAYALSQTILHTSALLANANAARTAAVANTQLAGAVTQAGAASGAAAVRAGVPGVAGAVAGNGRLLGGATAATALGLGVSLLPNTGNEGIDRTRAVLGGAVAGAGQGAIMGLAAGPKGALIGGAIGGALGAATGFFTSAPPAAGTPPPAQSAGKSRVEELLEENNRLLRGIREGNLPLSTTDVSARDQIFGMLEAL